MQIGTQARAENAVVRRTYYLDDLLVNLPRVIPVTMDVGTMTDDKAPPAAQNAGRAGKGSAAPRPPRRAVANDSNGDIIRLITASLRPEIWKVNGGTIGEIAIVGNRVIVTAPQSVQALLEGPSHVNHNPTPLYIGVGQ